MPKKFFSAKSFGSAPNKIRWVVGSTASGKNSNEIFYLIFVFWIHDTYDIVSSRYLRYRQVSWAHDIVENTQKDSLVEEKKEVSARFSIH